MRQGKRREEGERKEGRKNEKGPRERERKSWSNLFYSCFFFFKLKCSIPPLNRLKYNYDLWNEFNK